MKKIICILFGLVAAVAAFGQSFLESIYLMPDKGLEAVYAKGETIKIYADAPEETPALVKVYRNGQFEGMSEITLQAGRTEVFSGSYDEAAALMVRLANPQDQNDSTTVGAIVAPEEFLPGFEEPADFRDFWKKQLKTLRRERMKVKLTPVEIPGEDAENYVCYDLEINCLDFRPVRGYLAMPRNAKRRSLPIAIYAHSAGKLTAPYTRATVTKAVSLAKSGNGAIGLDINAHGMLNGQDEAYYAALEEELHGYSGRTVTDHESFYFRGMFLRLVRALDYLCTRKEWDRKHVLVTGGSQGGAQSAALAGLDPRVTTVVVDVPAMWDTGGILKGRTSCWTKPLERDGIDSPAATIMPYYDACNFMRYFKGDLVVNVGLIDLTCPPASVWSVYNVCPARTKIIHPCAWKGHSGKYSVPTKDERNRIRGIMNKYIDDAIDTYLK